MEKELLSKPTDQFTRKTIREGAEIDNSKVESRISYYRRKRHIE